ncbi:hypothetical protein AN189_12295 [Loktanella sp. 3ANDIMAR09]|uniref:hypothetical protein n=1 Tax=Loktanella sp. 3ANDIMAR09 TaxID=1225657 RepID=UPI0006F7CDEA|nr:hypothetical protein [Loktanella sp. 3ANDIMAR09]KQI68167.1 hypothetical protein AN189_12295 [Loktanella sp. 3ANDIMAR09]
MHTTKPEPENRPRFDPFGLQYSGYDSRPAAQSIEDAACVLETLSDLITQVADDAELLAGHERKYGFGLILDAVRQQMLAAAGAIENADAARLHSSVVDDAKYNAFMAYPGRVSAQTVRIDQAAYDDFLTKMAPIMPKLGSVEAMAHDLFSQGKTDASVMDATGKDATTVARWRGEYRALSRMRITWRDMIRADASDAADMTAQVAPKAAGGAA